MRGQPRHGLYVCGHKKLSAKHVVHFAQALDVLHLMLKLALLLLTYVLPSDGSTNVFVDYSRLHRPRMTVQSLHQLEGFMPDAGSAATCGGDNLLILTTIATSFSTPLLAAADGS